MPAELAVAYAQEDDTERGLLAFLLLSLVGYPWLFGALVATLSRRVRSPLEPFGRTVDRVPALVVASLITFVATAVGLILLILPGLLIGARLSAATPLIVVERAGPIAALQRSNDLVRGRTWPVVGAFVIVLVVGLAVGLPGLLLTLLVDEPWAIGLGNAAFGAALNLPTAALAFAVYRVGQDRR